MFFLVSANFGEFAARNETAASRDAARRGPIPVDAVLESLNRAQSRCPIKPNLTSRGPIPPDESSCPLGPPNRMERGRSGAATAAKQRRVTPTPNEHNWSDPEFAPPNEPKIYRQ